MIDGVVKTIRQFNMIEEGDKIVVGVSGGADSVCLLLNLVEYQRQKNFELQVVHVNHLIRDDAAQDAEFVKKLCLRLNIPFFYVEEDVAAIAREEGLTVEEAGRYVRYKAFRTSNCNKIAVGHNRDDSVETFMFNLCRGSGLRGLTGIAPVTESIIRPLINTSRLDIQEYLGSMSQEYRTDSTNLQTDYTRNKLRLEIIPAMEQGINSRTKDHIAAISEELREVSDYMDEIVQKLYDENCYGKSGELSFDKGKLRALPPILIRQLILKGISDIVPGRKDITRAHVDSIVSLINAKGEKLVSLPYGLRAVAKYDKIVIDKSSSPEDTYKEGLDLQIMVDDESPEWEGSLDGGITIRASLFPYKKSMTIPCDICVKWFDYDKIKCCVQLRSRKTGDFMELDDQGHTKSIKKLMIDEKLQSSQRESWPMLADGNHVMWVLGLRMSNYYKVKDDTKRILEIRITGRDYV